jgi:hypothetical protein
MNNGFSNSVQSLGSIFTFHLSLQFLWTLRATKTAHHIFRSLSSLSLINVTFSALTKNWLLLLSFHNSALPLIAITIKWRRLYVIILCTLNQQQQQRSCSCSIALKLDRYTFCVRHYTTLVRSQDYTEFDKNSDYHMLLIWAVFK